MSITMMGLLFVLSVPIIITPPPIPVKYNTENVIVKFNDKGVAVWERSIPVANETSKILFEPDSICIVKCESGGYAVASPIQCQKNGNKTWGVLLSRIDESGNVIWKRVFDELDIELDLSLVEVQSGGFVIAGTANFLDEESNSLIRRVFLIYTEYPDDSQWILTYPELTSVRLHSLVTCANGDFAIAGTTEIYSDVASNVLLARIDEDGRYLWGTSIGGSLNDEGNALLECDDGGFVVVGSTQFEYNDKDVLLVRTAADGLVIWNFTYEDVGISEGWSVCPIDDGGFAVTGLRRLSLLDSFKTLFLVVESDGELVTKETIYYDSRFYAYGNYDDCRGHAIIKTNDGGFIIAGTVRYNHFIDEWGMMILRTDTSGGLLSNSTYGKNAWFMACSLVACEDQGFTVAGVRISPAR
jgi:hypothetical protein